MKEQSVDEGSYQDSVLAKDKLMSIMKERQEEMAVIDARYKEVETRLKETEKKLGDLVKQRLSALQDKNSAFESLRVANEEKMELEDGRAEKVAVVVEYTEGATKVGPRVPVPQAETGSSLEKKLEKVIKDIDQYEKK